MWPFIVLGGLLCLILSAPCVPLDVSLTHDTTSAQRLSLKLAWPFGLFRFRPGKRTPRLVKPRDKRSKKGETARKRDTGLVLRILHVKGMVSAIARFIRRILRCLEVRDLQGDLTIGLDDPADTGILMGALIPAGIALSHLTGRPLGISPSFGGAVLQWRGTATVRLVPMRLLWATTRIVLSMPAFGALKLVIVSRWKRRK